MPMRFGEEIQEMLHGEREVISAKPKFSENIRELSDFGFFKLLISKYHFYLLISNNLIYLAILCKTHGEG